MFVHTMAAELIKNIIHHFFMRKLNKWRFGKTVKTTVSILIKCHGERERVRESE